MLARIIIWFLFLGASACLPAEAGIISPDFEDLHTCLLQALERADQITAFALFDEAALRYPGQYTAHNYAYRRGRLHLQAADPAGAEARFLESVHAGERLADYALLELSELVLARGERVLCDHYLNRLLSDYPDSLHRRKILARLGENAFGAGDFDRAIAYTEDLIREEAAGGTRKTRYRLAEYHLDSGRIEEGAKLLGRFIDDRQNDDLAWQGLERLEKLEKDGKIKGPDDADTLYNRGRVCYDSRKFDRAIAYFRRALASARKTADILKINYLLGKAHFRLGQYGEAIPVFSWIEARDQHNAWKSESLYMAGRARQMNDDLAGAGRSFMGVIDLGDDAVLTTSAALRICRFPDGIISRDSKSALLRRLVKRRLPLQEQRKLALRLAEMDVEDGRLDQARATLEKVGDPEGRGWERIHFERARLAGHLGHGEEALALYGDILELSPRHFYRFAAEEAMLALIPDQEDFLRDVLTRAAAAIESSDLEQARRLLSRLPLFSLPPNVRGPCVGMLSRCYERQKDYRAGLSLDANALEKIAGGAGPMPEERKKLSRALAFIRLRLFEEAAGELEYHLEDRGDDLDLLLSGARTMLRGGRPAQAIWKAGSVVARLPDDFQPILFPEALMEMLYPFYYKEAVKQFSAPRAVDALFVLAVIREESRFNPGVRSGAAAKGLMQFIPETAASVAASVGLEGFEEDHLYDPRVSINLGTKHLADLMKRYGGDVLQVLSAYNAGPTKTNYWKMNAAGSDPHSFMMAIQFSETRRYIEKVMSSYYLYQYIYRDFSAGGMGSVPDPASH